MTIDKFIALAEKNQNILAIGIEGSLNNPQTTADKWTDTDITLFVQSPEQEDGEWWIRQFGKPIIVQRLHSDQLFGSSTSTWKIWLTRYAGTKRIDLKIASVKDIENYLNADTLNVIVWRRGLGKLPLTKTTATSHFVKIPTEDQFNDHVTEFYWCAGNVVKGLARNNLIYANEQLNQIVRPELLKMWAYYLTILKAGQFDAGVSSKFVWKELALSERNTLASTYHQTTIEETSHSLEVLLISYRELIEKVTSKLMIQIPNFVLPAQQQLMNWLNTKG
ncbi:aminoglycoside 6-adenylyltransferase [Pediococcus ethanolidurans]|uniref:aminoglycoside 6-adenylyltransferase n=1 Tax=Pediococcus ethanolidurans TaxID=319653 RepID=UPI002954A995|nr:aminoglycoside 6-adenylyltransferase [Pediococcus ethanolidurans]